MSRARTSVCFAALVSIAALMAATDFEQLPTFRAGEILPASVAKGDRHQVEDEVKNVGYLNHYGIESDFGHFEAIGTARLIIRLREISALGELDELSNTKVFADAVLAGATQSAKVVASVAKHPVETIKGVPAGVGKLFGRTKRTVESTLTAKGEPRLAQEQVPSVVPVGKTVDLEELRQRRNAEMARKAAQEQAAAQPPQEEGEYQSTTERLLAAKRKAKQDQDDDKDSSA